MAHFTLRDEVRAAGVKAGGHGKGMVIHQPKSWVSSCHGGTPNPFIDRYAVVKYKPSILGYTHLWQPPNDEYKGGWPSKMSVDGFKQMGV